MLQPFEPGKGSNALKGLLRRVDVDHIAFQTFNSYLYREVAKFFYIDYIYTVYPLEKTKLGNEFLTCIYILTSIYRFLCIYI